MFMCYTLFSPKRANPKPQLKIQAFWGLGTYLNPGSEKDLNFQGQGLKNFAPYCINDGP
jgi:hypothetical protein